MTIYLYKKTHNKTGMQYLGKTTKDPLKYKGSGKDWVPHINEHGYDVTTEILRECSSNEELSVWGRYYSELWNITESDTWANRIPETGGGLGVASNAAKTENIRRWSDPAYREKMKAIHNHPARLKKNAEKMKTLWQTKEYVEKQLSSHRSSEFRSRNSVIQKEVQNRPDVKAKLSGRNSYRYDHTIYEFIHTSGKVEHCTQYELIQKYELEQRNLNAVVKGKRKRCKGWSLMRENFIGMAPRPEQMER